MTREQEITRRRFLRRASGFAGAAAGSLLLPQSAKAGGFLGNLLGTNRPSPDEQKKLGDQAAQQIMHQYPEIHDARASHFVSIGERLVAALPDEDRRLWNFRFHVLESKDINAFALPGGNMFLFTGLYSKVTTDDALAAVTGHEMTHVRKQHWAKRYVIEQQRGLALTFGMIMLHAGEVGQSAAGLYDNLSNLKYSRGEEDQADQGGLLDMVAAGYNPEGMVQLFEVLEKAGGNGGGGPVGDLLEDHPLTSERIKRTQERIALLAKTHVFPPLTPLDYKALIGQPATFPGGD